MKTYTNRYLHIELLIHFEHFFSCISLVIFYLNASYNSALAFLSLLMLTSDLLDDILLQKCHKVLKFNVLMKALMLLRVEI